ncbi:MAG: rubrerythrin family protein [Clostridiaceae bacterium]
MKSLKGTMTAENLLKAYTGESQAVVQYAIFSSIANKEGYKQITDIFQETADNEAQHAKRYYRMLLDGFANELPAEIATTITYSVAQNTTLENLLFSINGEMHEASSMYPGFSEVADKEGFPEVAAVFRSIATVEQHHGERFSLLAENIKNGKVFKKDVPTSWKCSKCGYISFQEAAPLVCPACLHPQSYFSVEPYIY